MIKFLLALLASYGFITAPDRGRHTVTWIIRNVATDAPLIARSVSTPRRYVGRHHDGISVADLLVSA